ncbi:MAG TPA: hypothetical protein VKB38_16200 [Terracidiphilus sp.]|nr:hypothetical protein [Terracidiphilus sp.]
MKRRAVLFYALYLLILSALFVPFSHGSSAQFAKECFIRLGIVSVFAAVTLRVINIGSVEPYRITEAPPRAIASEDVLPANEQDTPAMLQSQLPPKRRRSVLVFWVVVFALYCVTQTAWWSRQAWASRFTDTAIRWGISLFCWSCLALLWIPKPDANQPEELHVVPSNSSKINLPPGH